MSEVFQIANAADYEFDCPDYGCLAKKGEACKGANVEGGKVHFGRRLLRVAHQVAKRDGLTFEEVWDRLEQILG